jgi:methionyl-tRNA formyltransferase
VFINTHVGITPKYRGVHGGYWALANNDMQHFGVTVHKIDAGIDTGEVLYQKVILPTSSDNFSTYPLLQTAEGIKLILNVIEDFNFEGLRSTQSLVNESKLWYHPTLWGYLYLRIKKGIK